MPLCFIYLSLSLLISFYRSVSAQTISTNTPVPPLQWINLSNLLQGSAHPPPLKDAAIGYDETSRSIIIFGGESENGFPQSETYLLNLDSLTWSSPSPPANLQRSPPARSAVVFGSDFAASNRHGFVVIGGKGTNEKPLSDVWEYDFNNQFWSEVNISPGGPSPRWGASGGIDIRTAPIQDSIVPGPNNTFYLAGGFDGTQLNQLSDVWRLNISGTLSSNLPDDSMGSWDRVIVGGLPPKLDQGGTVLSQQIISSGGCNTTATSTDASCAQQDSYVTDVRARSSISPGACPAPRLSPVLTPNLNTFSTSYTSQVFLLLGNFNSSLWQDNNGLQKGEVAVLDTNTGTWSRILPSGDPGTSGMATFPGPREGAAGLSYPQSLVGQSRSRSADTIVFGGRDASGKYLSDVWLLRAYHGTVTPSNPTWSGFGNGNLQTGVDADGSGVRIQYILQCASSISEPTSASPSVGATPSPTTSPDPIHTPSPRPLLNTSFLHKLLAPVSLIVFQLAFLLLRFSSPSFARNYWPGSHNVGTFIAFALMLGAYAIGIAGLVASFTSISSTLSLTRRSISTKHLTTGHGKAGIALFICLYVLTPFLGVSVYLRRRSLSTSDHSEKSSSQRRRSNSVDTGEKLDPIHPQVPSATQSTHNTSPPSSPRPRTLSWGPSSMWQRSHEGGTSTDNESITSGPSRGFEVINRPSRSRQLSLPISYNDTSPLQPRVLGDIDWLLRRRSLNAVGELDYAITQAHNARSAPDTGDALVTPAATPPLFRETQCLPPSNAFLRLFAHGSILGLSIVCLVALWSGEAKYLFALFLAWTLFFYISIFLLTWHRRPENSLLTIIVGRLRNNSPQNIPQPPLSPLPHLPQHPSYAGQSPYTYNRPPYHVSPTSPDEISTSHGVARSTETDEEDDIDEDTRQRMIEEEMERRDVSIVTVPKRKLWVANPS
ncbi:hypothetical protein BDQ12DRAFT_731551 [Crucibulum laeve]|uniref:Cortical protein marker for cell polarity-domain-containing protein n=1 Tax=Crucibulum laeve TaxID=68775 RepID=A0A5C3MFW9_9AGAR|nr:hypothetical protein BDQ12DRAFT_731551 [Crucibulum laeve]